MVDFHKRKLSAFFSALLLGACQTAAEEAGASDAAPAILQSADSQTMDALKSALAKAVGRARIELGPGDLMQSSTISILPPRPGDLETHSLARPVLFDLMINDGRCYAMRRDTGQRYDLPGVACRALDG